MKKIVLGLTAIMFLSLSCTNGSATAIDQSGEGSDAVIAANFEEGNDAPDTGSGKPVHLTKKDFLEKVMNYEKNQTEWVYEGDLPAIIDFYADWCAPCRLAAPVLEELAEEYEGKIHVYKVDTEQERELAAVFGISSIPAFLFIPQEGRPTMSSGVAQTQEDTKKMFVQLIDEILLVKN